jgi:tetratricopeptide (TPR) repeat protein
MNYTGNPSLSAEVRQRILSTFEQTLELARDGNRQEALLGCDFVLRMDPQFDPAHVLQERLRASTGPVQVQDLMPGGAPAADDPFADLDSLSLELPDLPASLPGLSELPGLPGIDGSLRTELQGLSDQRRFGELMTRAQAEQAAIANDPELQRLLGAAQEKMEAEPYVLKFLGSARQALEAGQTDEVGRLLDKARALDPTHPGIGELERARDANPVANWTASGPSPSPPPPSLVIPPPLQTSAMPASLAFGGGDSESDRRIRELLDEGQTAFDAGDPQGAIDAWSRIFLIDIDHQEASRRIESARKLKAESERQVEEIFHDGLSHLDTGDTAAARQAFERVLEIQPGYFAAREQLQQLDTGIGSVPRPKPPGPREVLTPTPELPDSLGLEASGRDLKEEILVPPEPPDQAAPERRPTRKPAARRDPGRARRLFLLVGGAVLLLAIAGAVYFFMNRDQMFPNSQPEETAAAPADLKDPIARAQRLNKAGRTAIALNQLRRIPPTDPHYREAQKLIAEWGGGAPATTEGTPAAAGTPGATPAPGSPAGTPSNDERRAELLSLARQAYAEGTYLKTLNRLEQAGAIAKLDGDDAKLLADVKQKLEPLAKSIDLFRQHEWEFVAQDMWRQHEAAPANRDVTQLLVDSYYNLAVRDLQRNDTPKAVEKLQQVVELQDDPLVRRHLQFAQTYQDKPKDLLYRIYVKYLQYR